jgi:hypothetical protein
MRVSIPIIGHIPTLYHPRITSYVFLSSIATLVHHSPSSLVREHGMGEFSFSSVKRHSAVQGDVINSPVPDTGVHHAICGECHDGTDDCAGETVIPVVELVDGQGSSNEGGAEDWGICCDQLPHCGMIV